MTEDWEQEQIQDHYHYAHIISVIAETNRNEKKRTQPFTIKDFSWNKEDREPKKKQMTDDEIYNALVSFFGEPTVGGN